jgi:hypothetical protein
MTFAELADAMAVIDINQSLRGVLSSPYPLFCEGASSIAGLA